MSDVGIRGSVVAAVASIFVLSCSVTTPVHAQQTAALAANPELAAKGVWDPATTYVIDDIVTSRGSTWRSKRNNNLNKVPGQTSPSTATYWELFSRGFNPAGEWLSSTKYQPDDLVTRNGQTFRAKITNTNRAPAANQFWELLAQKGEKGEQGEQGDVGPQGLAGAAGAAGATGATGATGPEGPQGPQGIQGPAGSSTGIANGTLAAPSIAFGDDADTGIYSPEDGKIALVGDGALFLHNLGLENTALGTSALQSNGGGRDNTAVGFRALQNNTGGNDNIALGAFALLSNTDGGTNIAVGANALQNNTTGSGNHAIGAQALLANTTGPGNTAIGIAALTSNTTGDDNIAVGESALGSNTTGFHNIAIGRQALQSHVEASANIALGYQALRFATGENNIGIGYFAGSGLTSGFNNIAIGNLGASGDIGVIRIGDRFLQTTTFIAGISGVQTGGAAVPVLVDTNGQLGTVSSSRRYKYDIAAMPEMSEVLAKLRPVTFRYKQAQNDGSHPLQYGLIAEEVADVFPDLALFNKDGSVETVNYHLLPSFLLAGYQAQQKTIAAQAEKIEAQAYEMRRQKEINAALEARLARLEALLPQTKAAALRK